MDLSPPRSDLVIFLGGAPGAGKSSAAGILQARLPGLVVANAGQLIRQGLGVDGEYRRPPVAGEDHAASLQDVLVSSFARLRCQYPGPILLDGHYAVPTNVGPVAVPATVFRRLGCNHLIVIEAPPMAELAGRLRRRGGASWWDGSGDALVRLVDADWCNAHAVAETLSLPLSIVGGVEATVDEVQRLITMW